MKQYTTVICLTVITIVGISVDNSDALLLWIGYGIYKILKLDNDE